MDCAYKVGEKCMGFSRYRKHCGLARTALCGERRKFNAIIKEKRHKIEKQEYPLGVC